MDSEFTMENNTILMNQHLNLLNDLILQIAHQNLNLILLLISLRMEFVM